MDIPVTDIQIIDRHFDSIIVLDKEGRIEVRSLMLRQYPNYQGILTKMAIIVEMRGFYRGNTKTAGKWMPKWTMMNIVNENPEWLHINVIAREYGI